jgi:hypothetical protein
MTERTDDEQDENSIKRVRKMKLLVALIAILFVIISIYYCFQILYPKEPAGNIPAMDKTNETTLAFINNPQVLTVVTDINAPVSNEIGMPRTTLIQEYINDCISLINARDKIQCLDKYYYNNYPELKQKEDSCKKNDKNCLDEYFMLASDYEGQDYCDAISDNTIKQQCLLSLEK